MCIKCLVEAMLATEEERARNAKPEAEPAEPITLQDQADALEIERMHAEIRNIDADTILKLANAAHALNAASLDTDGVLRTMEGLLVPARASYATEPAGPTEPAPETPASTGNSGQRRDAA